MGEMKTYLYELKNESGKAIQIIVPTKNKEKLYEFWIPKSVIINLNRKYIKNKYSDQKKWVEITMDSDMFYQFTWKKIIDWMEKRGIQIKQKNDWNGM